MVCQRSGDRCCGHRVAAGPGSPSVITPEKETRRSEITRRRGSSRPAAMSPRPTPPTAHTPSAAPPPRCSKRWPSQQRGRQHHRWRTRGCSWRQIALTGRRLALRVHRVGDSAPAARDPRRTKGAAVSSPTATHSPPRTSPIPHQMTPADLRSPTFTPPGRSSATSTVASDSRHTRNRASSSPPGLAVCPPMSTHRPFSNWNRITPVSVGLCFVVSGVVLRPGGM